MSFNAAFWKWFGASKVVDKRGAPLLVYRGEYGPASKAFATRRGTISFGSKKAATYYARNANDRLESVVNPRVFAAYVRIENPFLNNPTDPFLDLSVVSKKLGKREAMRIARKFSNDIEYTSNWAEGYSDDYSSVAALLKAKPKELGNLYFDAYKFFDDRAEVEKLKRAGFDGAIHVGNGETIDEVEYKIFHPDQAAIMEVVDV